MCLTSKTPVLVCGCQKSLVLFLAKKAAGRNCLLILRFASRLFPVLIYSIQCWVQRHLLNSLLLKGSNDHILNSVSFPFLFLGLGLGSYLGIKFINITFRVFYKQFANNLNSIALLE